MASWTQQALLEATREMIWELLTDPTRYPEWAGDALETTGVPTKIEKGATFEQTVPGPLGMKATTTFEVAELEDLREIKLACQMTGYYSHWRLTEAQDQTFADVEIGIDPNGVPGQGQAGDDDQASAARGHEREPRGDPPRAEPELAPRC